jgi:hypothetical protein
MAFKIKVLLSAQKDPENAVEYYHKISSTLSERFYSEFLNLNSIFRNQSFFEVKYKSVRTYKLRSFPYLVHFVINENINLVTIIAVVFDKQEKNNFEIRSVSQ